MGVPAGLVVDPGPLSSWSVTLLPPVADGRPEAERASHLVFYSYGLHQIPTTRIFFQQISKPPCRHRQNLNHRSIIPSPSSVGFGTVDVYRRKHLPKGDQRHDG